MNSVLTTQFEAAGSVWLAIVAVAMLFAAAFAVGSFPFRSVVSLRWHWVDIVLLRFTVGLNLLSFAGVILGQLGALANGRSVWILIPLAGLGVYSLWTLRKRLWRVSRPQVSTSIGDLQSRKRHGRETKPQQGHHSPLTTHQNRSTSHASRVAGFAALALACITLGPALCYPFAWDELVYHSVLPVRWLAAGRPSIDLDLPYSAFPSFGEILFWMIAPIEHVIAPRLLVWACWIMGLSCLCRLLLRRMSSAKAVLFTLAFCLNDTLLVISANCYVESILLLNVGVLMLAFDLPGWRERPRQPWVQAIVIGILAGGSAAMKLTGGAVVVVPILWYGGQFVFGRTPRRSVFGPAAVAFVTAMVFAFPFYLRPWLATGNPFYPYLCDWFTNDITQLEMSHYHHAIGGIRFGIYRPIGFVAGPLLLAFSAENYDGEFGWQLLVFVGLALIALVSITRRLTRPLVLWPFAVALWFFAFWFATAQQARFATSFVFALVLMAGIGMKRLSRPWQTAAIIALLVAIPFSIPWRKFDFYPASWLTVAGRRSRSEYVHYGTRGVYLPLVQAIDTVAPVDAQILLIYEHRGFFLTRRHRIGTPLYQQGPFSPPQKYADPSVIMNELQNMQITHVVIAKLNPGPDNAPGWVERQQPFLRAIEMCVQQRRLVKRWESAEYVLLQVRNVK